MNPCWETATKACEGMRYEEMVTRLDVTDDFCAVSESGAYCRDLYHKGAKQDCAALRVSS